LKAGTTEVLANFPKKLAYLFEPHRYKVAYGGRGGAKSWGFARALLLSGVQRQERILCTREVQKSIKDSVHSLLSDQIQSLGLGHLYDVLETEIRGKKVTTFLFYGMANVSVEYI
jgi:phage terminase large subunit